MYKREREQQILFLLQEHQEMAVAELAKLLYTSESSIRRDLTAMELNGLVKRTHGGVKLIAENPALVPFSSRLHLHIAEKKKIAKKALSFVQDGQVIFLDQSSSALFVAHELVGKKQVTIITNNIEILTTMSKSKLKVYASGGYISPTNRNCLIGEDAHEIFAKTHADVLFFSVKALSSDGKLYEHTREEIHIHNTMLENASKKIFLCDSGKFDNYASYEQCSLKDIDCMLSEVNLPEKYAKFFK
ncbi:MAG: DeoR/GlpR transcriptional regulator [Lachnospiraceae bacterium]|nr:DeoR/GlpR transcriptional regulator [Lachnospiraceae bacterium]